MDDGGQYKYIYGEWVYLGPVKKEIICNECHGRALLQPDGTYVCQNCGKVFKLKKE
jgi:DNA-directed RNA polymerase subunit RPC12/RpoP